jgi:hypothetical protein
MSIQLSDGEKLMVLILCEIYDHLKVEGGDGYGSNPRSNLFRESVRARMATHGHISRTRNPSRGGP